MARPLGDLDIWAVFIDSIHFGEHIDNLVARGLAPNRSRLFVVDGSKGLRAALRSHFGRRASCSDARSTRSETSSGIRRVG
jgi:hypothetical protein